MIHNGIAYRPMRELSPHKMYEKKKKSEARLKFGMLRIEFCRPVAKYEASPKTATSISASGLISGAEASL